MKAQSWLVVVFMFVYIHFNVPSTRVTELVKPGLHIVVTVAGRACDYVLKPGLHISCKARKHMVTNMYFKAWSPYSCNGRNHHRKHVSDSVPSSSDTREHFDYNIASLTGIVINCSVSSSCNDRSNH